uniref:Uncharacterized protein n=1 Tax=Rhizophora mucronata TaxID=61149 RepID=A0A2P2MZ92_RHIMU
MLSMLSASLYLSLNVKFTLITGKFFHNKNKVKINKSRHLGWQIVPFKPEPLWCTMRYYELYGSNPGLILIIYS